MAEQLDEILRLQAAMESTQRKLDALTSAYQRGKIQVDQYNNLQTALTKRLTDQTAAFGKAATTQIDVTNRVATASRNYGMAAMYVAQGLEDMNYGIQNSFNNLSGVAMLLGAPTGVVVGTQLLAAAGIAVARNWDYLSRAFGQGPRFASIADDIERVNKALEETKKKAADDPVAFAGLTDATVQAARLDATGQMRHGMLTRTNPLNDALGQAMQGVLANEDIRQMSRIIGGNIFKNTPDAAVAMLPERTRKEFQSTQKTIEGMQKEIALERIEPGRIKNRAAFDAELDRNQKRLGELKLAANEAAAQHAQNVIANAALGSEAAIEEFLTFLEGGARANLPERGGLAGKLRRAAETTLRRRIGAQTRTMLRDGLIEGAAGTSAAGTFGRPAITEGQKDQAAAGFQESLAAMGLSEEEQARFAGQFAGKDVTGDMARRRLRMVPQIVATLKANGFTDREIAQVMPDIIQRIESGANPITAIQSVVNQVNRLGMRRAIGARRGGLRNLQAQQAEFAGAAMLGLAPETVNPQAWSRISGVRNNIGAMDTGERQARAADDNTLSLQALTRKMDDAINKGIPLTLRRR